MRVLLLVQDLYRTVGGGETAYRRLIESNPEVDFVYFRVREANDARRPSNAKPVGLLAAPGVRPEASLARSEAANLRRANQFCRAVAGQAFDVVEFPDYVTFGSFLRDCLAHHEVGFKALVISLHGNISTAVELGWMPDAEVVKSDRVLELQQFLDADARYAISRRYMAEWHARAQGEVHYVDPLAIVGNIEPVAWAGDGGRPGLYCIGRAERRKGNDLFVELVRWLDREAYGGAWHVGPDELLSDGGSSRAILEAMARTRAVTVSFLPGQDLAGMRRIYAGNSLVILPVRYDPFNLVALEALLAGCPVAVSSGAGVCDYLDEAFAGVPYLKVDPARFYGNVPAVEALLRDYAGERTRLLRALDSARRAAPPFRMAGFYEEAVRRAASPGRAARPARRYDEASLPLAERSYEFALRSAPEVVKRAAKRIVRAPRATFGGLLRRSGLFGTAKMAWHALRSARLPRRLKAAAEMPEADARQIDGKVEALEALGANPLFRCDVWRALARLERLRGNDLIAATYEIRLMRLLGVDWQDRLAQVVETLERHRLGEVARACAVLYGGAGAAAVHEYLDASYRRALRAESRDWEYVDDRRRPGAKVSIIVSLYNAADKLQFFLSSLVAQPMVRRGEAEVVLVDSGSPTAEREVAAQFLAGQPMSAVYARSRGRETIQAAWNRGIQLARAPYLVFLGVDETLYPEALDLLAERLDRNPAVDWVMADSLVTEVDPQGLLRNDVMVYDRAGGTKDHTYLETCYLSWVGGMYRKSIHERFGYYDETFRAAGDTEFKNRILPHITVEFVPRLLGLFLNYPDARTTASPLAELEDTRAWYIHRSAGGVRYAFGKRGRDDVLNLLFAALGYRKSYCRHLSSDVDYARELLAHLKERGEAGAVAGLEPGLERLLGASRGLDWSEAGARSDSPPLRLATAWWTATSLQREHARLAHGRGHPAYKVFNDNRYEQHFWLWETA